MESKFPLLPRIDVIAREVMNDLPEIEDRVYYVGPEAGTFRDDRDKKPVVCSHSIANAELPVKPKATLMMARVAQAVNLLEPAAPADLSAPRDFHPPEVVDIRNMTNAQRQDLVESNISLLKDARGDKRPGDVASEFVELIYYCPEKEKDIADSLIEFIDTTADTGASEEILGVLVDKAAVVAEISEDLFDNHPELIDKSMAVVDALLRRRSVHEKFYAVRPMINLLNCSPVDVKGKLAEVIESLITISDDKFEYEKDYHHLMQVRPSQALYIAKLINRVETERRQDLRNILYHTICGVIDEWPSHDAVQCAAEMIGDLRQAHRASVIKSILELEGAYDQAKSVATGFIRYVEESEKVELMELAGVDDEGFGQSVLSMRASVSDEILEFGKTGSSTYILPKQHCASMRVVSANSAKVWAEAFYDWAAWHRAGFSYVPVEPIEDIDFYHQRWSGGVVVEVSAVVTSNLAGRSLADWKRFRQDFMDELTTQRKKIVATLERMGIEHGHLHDGNFVVVPYKTSNGQVDYSRCPRLYVIDFDQASKVQFEGQ